MDEAERCHRLAFIFGGDLLDVGTPIEIVERRRLRVAELEITSATEAADLLRAQPEVDEVAHYGSVLRVATKNLIDPEKVARQTLEPKGIAIDKCKETRVTVEDAFVSMVREDARRRDPRRAA